MKIVIEPGDFKHIESKYGTNQTWYYSELYDMWLVLESLTNYYRCHLLTGKNTLIDIYDIEGLLAVGYSYTDFDIQNEFIIAYSNPSISK